MPAETFEELIRLFEMQSGSKGGWWALSGFSFQTAIYLEQFFGRVATDGAQVPDLPMVEALSDIYAPDGAGLRLIQVKRTLRRSSLVSTLAEACKVAALCTHELLGRIRFQVAYSKRETDATPAQIGRTEVGKSIDEELWNRVLKQFDHPSSMLPMDDPIDRLYYLLWSKGITDVRRFVDICRGRLLATFENPSRERILLLRNELTHLFFQNRNAMSGLGHLISPVEVMAQTSMGGDYNEIVFGRAPRIEDLRRCRFANRESVFESLLLRFDLWWTSLLNNPDRDRLAIFWIDGRSGDGKSVLMLQLVQFILSCKNPPAIVDGITPEQVPEWVAARSQEDRPFGGTLTRPVVGLVDDLHSLSDQDEWIQRMQKASRDHMPNVAIIATGPSTDLETFRRATRSIATIVNFSIPPLDKGGTAEIVKWFEERTKRSAPVNLKHADCRLLVVLLFELTQRETLGDFAKSFRRRLERYALADIATQILAINSLGLSYPEALFLHVSDRARDYFGALCRESHLHFERLGAAGQRNTAFRLAHPQIVWQLFLEWLPDHVSAATAWGRCLGSVLNSSVSSLGEDGVVFAEAIVRQAMISTRLKSETGLTDVGDTLELLSVLHARSAEVSRRACLHRWVVCAFTHPMLQAVPDPVLECLDLQSSALIKIRPSTAAWLWRLSETERYERIASTIRDHVQKVFNDRPDAPGIGNSISLIFSKSRNQKTSSALCDNWLSSNARSEQAYRILATLLASNPRSKEYVTMAMEWASVNGDHEQVYQLLSTLIATQRGNAELQAQVLRWLRKNPLGVRAIELLKTLAVAQRADTSVLHQCLEWLRLWGANEKAFELLKTLAANYSHDSEVRTRCLLWLQSCNVHSHGLDLLRTLVANNPSDIEVRSEALAWLLKDLTAKSVHEFLVVMLSKYAHDPGLRAISISWVCENVAHDHVPGVLCALISRSDNSSDEVRLAGDWWLSNMNFNKSHLVLAKLIMRCGKSSPWIDAGEAWIASEGEHRKAEILGALLASGTRQQFYLECLLKSVQGSGDTERDSYLYNLSLGVAKNAVSYIAFICNCADRSVRNQVLVALEKGVGRYSECARDVIGAIESAPVEYQGRLLSGCLGCPEIDDASRGKVARWLTENYRRVGYSAVLGAFKNHPRQWASAQSTGGISSHVAADFEAMGTARSDPELAGSGQVRWRSRRSERKSTQRPPPKRS